MEQQKTISTGRLIVKTSLKTFFVLMLVLIIAVSFFMLAFTTEAGDFFSDTFGWNGLGARLSYASYVKTCTNGDVGKNDGDINLLATASERAILKGEQSKMGQGDSDRIYEYAYKLVFHKDFEDYAEWMNGITAGSENINDYNNFIKGYLYAAMYRSNKTVPKFTSGNKTEAVRQAVSEMTDGTVYRYGINNPVSKVIAVCAADGVAPAAALQRLFEFFDAAYEFMESSAPAAELRNLCLDALTLANRHGTAEQKSAWQDNYDKY